MTRLIAILVTLFLVAIPAKADVTLWPHPAPGLWTVIQVWGQIQPRDLADFERYTEKVNPATTLIIVTGPGGNLRAGIGMGIRVHQKKLLVGVMGACTSSCALIWVGGETGRKFFYEHRPGVQTFLCFHQASEKTFQAPSGHMQPESSATGTAVIDQYLSALGYSRDMIEWAVAADPRHRRCLTSELAKEFHVDLWYNTEDAQHYPLLGNHGLLTTTSESQPSSAYIRHDGYYKYLDLASVWYLRFYSDGTVVTDQRLDTSSLPTTDTFNKTHFKGIGIFETDDHLIKFQLRTGGTLPSLEFNGQAWINEVNFPNQIYTFVPWQH
jgi:hypothetical protein